jgi:putative mycofactocin binding protein MftB
MAQPIVGLIDGGDPGAVAGAKRVVVAVAEAEAEIAAGQPAADQPAAGTLSAPQFDPLSHYRLHPRVALRPEPFGALAYHYGSRRLTFLRSPLLAELVRGLEQHASAEAALCATVPETKRPSYRRALADLAGSGFICEA